MSHRVVPLRGSLAQCEIPERIALNSLRELNANAFLLEEDFPAALLSYCSRILDGVVIKGKAGGQYYMWVLANILYDAGITSFNGYQVPSLPLLVRLPGARGLAPCLARRVRCMW